MEFCYVGINFHSADLNIRDHVAFTDQKKLELLEQAEQLGIHQCVILSTCNRSEVFYFTDQERMKETYCGMFPKIHISEYVEELSGKPAMEYFFRIAAGLESLVLGEDQILGQVREAYEFSKAAGATGKEMNKLVREAITCAKKIKTEIKISEQPLSVSYIGIRLIQENYGIEGKRALVIGSGHIAELAIRYLLEYHVAQVTVCSRNISHARRLREQFPTVEVVDYEKRYQILLKCGIVISATAAPHIVLQEALLREAMDSRKGLKEACVMLDLATPRDIDSRIGKLEGVHLVDLDALEQMSRENMEKRRQLVEVSRQWIGEAVAMTMDWMVSSCMDETIRSLQQRCAEIVEDTCQYLDRKLSLEPREQKLVRKMLEASLKRLIREPILELKQIDSPEMQKEYQQMVKNLFQL